MVNLIDRVLALGTKHVLLSRLDENRTPGMGGQEVRHCYPKCESIKLDEKYWDLGGSDHLGCRVLGNEIGPLKTRLYYNEDADGISKPRFDVEEYMEGVARVGGRRPQPVDRLAYLVEGMYFVAAFFNMRIPKERGSGDVTSQNYGSSMYGFLVPISRADVIDEIKNNPRVVIELFYRVFPEHDFTHRGLQLDTKRTYWGPLEPEPEQKIVTPSPVILAPKSGLLKRFGRWIR